MVSKELNRAPDYHEFHFWMGVAHLRLGELKQAERHLIAAKSNSTSQKDHAIYSAKLEKDSGLQYRKRIDANKTITPM